MLSLTVMLGVPEKRVDASGGHFQSKNSFLDRPAMVYDVLDACLDV